MITLRPYTNQDVQLAESRFYGQHAGDLQWFGYGSPWRQAEWQLNGLLTPDAGSLIVDEDGQAVGGVGWFKDKWGPPTSFCWEIAISLAAEARGRGIGSAAQVLLRDYLLDHTPVNRIQAITDIKNVAEQRALVKAGFTQEGKLRGAQWRAGEWHDQYIYSFLRSDR